ncbi:LacI family DNA-binding transcriptional regulator [Sphaerochaeta halotolerans]|uniref:LacI family DNA-binding transcriptional regulator n=1 Tax=Sphaerochaeta halotolerans TaxID=2293840 RepID=UPI0014042205|nr:LacI family DNA-binding transcriptional regulator [Sphaerochaeta halotolerans]
MKITLKEIAEKADVSISLVSKILNDKEVSVSSEKRERIIQLAKELRDDKSSISSIVHSKTNSSLIALIQPNLKFDFLADLTEQIELRANQRGFNVLILNSHEDIIKEREFLELSEKSFIKGIIVNVCDNNANIDFFKHLDKKGKPFVFVDRYIPDHDFNFVTTNNFTGAYNLTKQLIEEGNKNILFVFHGKSLFTTGQLDRFAGYQKAMLECGLVSQKEYLYSDRPISKQPINSDFSCLKKIDAVFLATSWDLLFFLKILDQHGNHIEKKIDIATFDKFSFNYPAALETDLINKHINSILIMEQNPAEIAIKAVDHLINQIVNRNNHTIKSFLETSKVVLKSPFIEVNS